MISKRVIGFFGAVPGRLLAALGAVGLGVAVVSATERSFTYTYEPETMPQGGFEYEQWVTLRAGRGAAVGQEDFNRWEFRHELEYGLTDNYTVSLYVNESLENFRDPTTSSHYSHFQFDGVSLENKYLVLNPTEHSVGLALYLEPRFAGGEAELEQKIILGQRHGDWKWAFNLTHATEWARDLHSTEGEVEASVGISRSLSPRWSVGLEARDHNELPDYARWENTALYVGPVATYRREKWWAALTVMPQVFGANFQGNPGKSNYQDLEGHERWNVRLLFGFDL
ncbi:MAG TPA: hypothetical protein VNZ64_12890 [Candidatus Acidoferrum sp.]|jgi:hypothetical protein|nr:hypothetical protein [Candidatus Acidoferrum sp.]